MDRGATKDFQKKVRQIWMDCQTQTDGINCTEFADEVYDVLIDRLIECGELPEAPWCRRGTR